MDQNRGNVKSSGSTIAKEIFFGFVAVALGGYNLLSFFQLLPISEAPRILGDILLIIVGLILWLTAFKLWRYRWHTSRLF
jgi:hypothetical protein